MRTIAVVSCVLPCLWLAGCGKDKKDKSQETAQDKPVPVTPEVAKPKPDPAKPDPTQPKPEVAQPKPDPAKEDAPLYFERALTKEELSGRSLRELALMRNTIFARGGNKFRKAWLDDHFSKQDWYKPQDKLDKSKISDLDWKNVKVIAEAERSFSKAQLDQRKKDLLAQIGAGQPTAEQRVELELISRRFGKWVGPAQVKAEKRSPLEDPGQLDRVLELSELDDMSRKDLRILRNTIYARRGYVFKSPILTDYFINMDWYKADEKYTDDRLSKVDWKNIKLVKSVENDLGGPVDDNEHGEEMDWFDGA